MERTEAYFSGRVQGVGFRYTAREIAAHFDVVGYVENLPDGRVHLIVEGEPPENGRFLERLQNDMSRYIRLASLDTQPATGEFDEFEIRH